MVSKSFYKILGAAVAFLFLLFPGNKLVASPVLGGVLGGGMLFSQPEKFGPEAVKTAKPSVQSSQEFFGTLGPELSDRGTVRTYSIKVVKNSRSGSSGKSKVRGLLENSSESFLRPVSGWISSSFGRRRHPKTGRWHFHTGIDIVAKKGTPIVAVMSGKVTYSGWKRGYGMVVIVNHGEDVETVYAHCSRLLVRSGQSIKQGQRVANIGNTGVSTGSHLHFEIRRGGHVRNPYRYVKN